MPLGLFGSSSSSKAQILPSEKSGEKTKHKSEKRDSSDNVRGTVLRLEKHVVTIEKKLAEGGFAIVYLVSDQKNRQFALKRQFVNDNAQQVDSCKRECLILSSLRGHRNIVQYVDHLIMKNKNGVYDCMLLTAYYKSSILQWMNARLSENRYFSSAEILSIFCDMCEAVARLHHATTPLIHRDLKVENILVDDRNRGAPPIFILCDFGSATTRVLSTEKMTVEEVKQEIERYTTLSYRSPEMVDLYSGKDIGTPSDIWALGVMVYKLCFFSLPFGESPLAIQNAAFSFPAQPQIHNNIKAITKLLLSADPSARPNIYQTAALAFEAAGKGCPVQNVHSVPSLPLSSVIVHLEGGGHPLERKEESGRVEVVRGAKLPTPPSPRVLPAPLSAIPAAAAAAAAVPSTSAALVSPLEDTVSSPRLLYTSTSTSVNPRLRPKGSGAVPLVPLIGSAQSSPQLPRANLNLLPSSTLIPTVGEKRALLPPTTAAAASAAETEAVKENTVATVGPTTIEVGGASAGTVESRKEEKESRHMRNLSDGGTLSKSAFRPYSETAAKPTVISIGVEGEGGREGKAGAAGPAAPAAAAGSEGWNAFTDAPIEERVGGRGWVEEDEEVDWSDPFRSAPFDPLPLMKERERQRLAPPEETTIESESEVDEQRALNRRSFSYEHIDGVGDDASTDSRGRTDGETTEDTGKEGEEGEDGQSTEGEGTDGGTMDDVAGSRPLLDDDGLEEDEDEEEEEYEQVTSAACSGSSGGAAAPSSTPIPSSFYSAASNATPPAAGSSLYTAAAAAAAPAAISYSSQATVAAAAAPAAQQYVPPAPPMVARTNPFNPFLVQDQQQPVQQLQQVVQQVQPKPVLPMGMDPPPTSIISLNDAFHQQARREADPASGFVYPSYLSSRAPATLPRQATSLAAAPRPLQPATPAAPAMPAAEEQAAAAAARLGGTSARRTSSPGSPERVTFTLQTSENRKCHSSMQYEKMGSSSDNDSVDTDDSVAGMCGGPSNHERGKREERGKRKEGKKKRRDTHPGQIGGGGGGEGKMKPAKKHSGTSKTASSNASFVNVSFQSEDVDRF